MAPGAISVLSSILTKAFQMLTWESLPVSKPEEDASMQAHTAKMLAGRDKQRIGGWSATFQLRAHDASLPGTLIFHVPSMIHSAIVHMIEISTPAARACQRLEESSLHHQF